jgi:hypothetical protein
MRRRAARSLRLPQPILPFQVIASSIRPFFTSYGPLTNCLPHPGVVLAIEPQQEMDQLRAEIESCSAFLGAPPRPYPFWAHMTIAEFISVERTNELISSSRRSRAGRSCAIAFPMSCRIRSFISWNEENCIFAVETRPPGTSRRCSTDATDDSTLSTGPPRTRRCPRCVAPNRLGSPAFLDRLATLRGAIRDRQSVRRSRRAIIVLSRALSRVRLG